MKLFLLCAVIVQGAIGAPQDQWGNWRQPWGQVPSELADPQVQLALAQQAQQYLQNQPQEGQQTVAQLLAIIQQQQIQALIQQRQQQIQNWIREQQWLQNLRQQGLGAWQNGPQQQLEDNLQPGGPLGKLQQRLEEKQQLLAQLWNNRPGPEPQGGNQGRPPPRKPHHPWRPHKPRPGRKPQGPPQEQPEQPIPEEPVNPDQTLPTEKVEEVQTENLASVQSTTSEQTVSDTTGEAATTPSDVESALEKEDGSTADVPSDTEESAQDIPEESQDE